MINKFDCENNEKYLDQTFQFACLKQDNILDNFNKFILRCHCP